MTYYNPKLEEADLYERLYQLDEDIDAYIDEKNLKIRHLDIVIAGSSALVFNNIHIKKTEDIDIIKISNYISEELLEKYDMNTRVGGLENFFPYNYQDRIIKLNLKTFIADYYILSLEDIAVAKIQADRGKDWEHLKNEELLSRINWSLLKICALEMEDSLLNDRQYQWFLSRYNYFVEVNGHEEIIIKNL